MFVDMNKLYPIRKKNKAMKYLQILFIILVVSCQNKKTNTEKKLEINFFDKELSWASNEPVLKIYFETNECGEFGGHEEHMKISKKNTERYKLEYEKYQVNCDSMVNVFDGIGYLRRPLNTLINKKEIEIDESKKQAILDFTNDMVKSKFNAEELISHSEIKMSIVNSDSTFYIWKYGGSADRYYKLLKGLKING